MNNNVIGEGIRKYRKQGNFSQEQFAKALGISAATLSAYETGKTIPDMSIIIKIANMFNTSTDDILGIHTPETEI